MMISTMVGEITLVYPPEEQEAADIVIVACEDSLRLVRETWNLAAPARCRIYVMTSGLGFVFQSAPWHWRVLLGVTIPLWLPRVQRTWPYSAGWTQRYGKWIAIGVKPPRLIEQSREANKASSSGRMYIEEKDMKVHVQHVVCHELVHACSAHLMLPMWLNEGIATLTVDRFAGKPTIQQETLAYMRNFMPKAPPPTYRQLSHMGLDAMIYHGVRGYWLVRCLESRLPGYLMDRLAMQGNWKMLEREIAEQLGLAPASFWSEIDGCIANYFEEQAAVSAANMLVNSSGVQYPSRKPGSFS